jgi:hypothetical protein
MRAADKVLEGGSLLLLGFSGTPLVESRPRRSSICPGKEPQRQGNRAEPTGAPSSRLEKTDLGFQSSFRANGRAMRVAPSCEPF